MNLTNKANWPWLLRIAKTYGFFALVSLLIFLPLLKPGYVLTLDMVFTPKLRIPASVTSSYLLRVALYAVNYVLAADVIEKLLLFGIFTLAGVGAYRLIGRLQKTGEDSRVGRYFAGTLYMINPFTYDRLMAGQYDVVFGYALLPWFVVSLFEFLRAPDWRRTARLAGWVILASIVSIHAVGFVFILAIVGAAIEAVRRRRASKRWLQQVALYGTAGIVTFVAASSYWLIPLLLGHSTTAMNISGFGAGDNVAFATVPGHFGLVGNLLALQGFWAEAQNLFLMPEDVFAWWWVPLVLLWVVVAVGLVMAWRRQRQTALYFSIIGLFGLILAIGTAGTVVAPLNGWLLAHVPLFSGYREPQKFAALIVLAYAYFGSVGVTTIAGLLKRAKAEAYAPALIVIPLLSAPLLAWGAHGQLGAHQYPDGWHQVNIRLLREDKAEGKVLFLPWHLYMPFGFAGGRVLANPAPQYFGVPIVSSEDPEFGGAHGYITDPVTRTVARQIIPSADNDPQLAQHLAALNIRYIIVAKDFDFQDYRFLNHKRNIVLVVDNPDLLLYRVTGT